MILTFSKSEFRDRIRKGIKIHTIRDDKYNRWKVGNKIHFWLGNPRNIRAIKPKEDGYYYVIWESGDKPELVYIWATKYGLTWGKDENDDPESVELDILNPKETKYYKFFPYQFGVGEVSKVETIRMDFAIPEDWQNDIVYIGNDIVLKSENELNSLAKNDGFNNWNQMKLWFDNQDKQYFGKIIFWKNFELTSLE